MDTDYQYYLDHQEEIRQWIELNKADTPLQAIVDVWNSFDNLPHVRKLTSNRRKFLKARIREHKAHHQIEFWQSLFQYVSENEFLPKPEHNWFDFDWVINESNFWKILEKKYE